MLVYAGDPAVDTLKSIGVDNGPFKDASSGNNILTIINTVISAALALLGVIFLILMLYAGYNWMVARGDEEKVAKAKETITRAIIGIIIVVGAYAISIFVMSRLETATLQDGSSLDQTPSINNQVEDTPPAV